MWQSLQTPATPAFLRWPWIETWLRELPDFVDRTGIELLQGNELLGLGVLASAGSDLWAMHHTGCDDLDVIFVEHNGLLLRPGAEPVEAYRAVLAFAEQELGATALRIDGTPDGDAVASAAGQLGANWHYRSRKTAPYRVVRSGDTRASLTAGRGEGGRQLRQSVALYEAKGPLLIVRAESPVQRRRLFNELVTSSLTRWRELGGKSAFEYEFFTGFHARLLGSHPEAVCLQAVNCGTARLAIHYSLVTAETQYAYQSVRRHEDNNRLRPGLVAHVLAMEAARPCAGARVYDFLGGPERYKRQLGSAATDLSWMVATLG